MRIMSYISLFAVLSMVYIATYQGWLKDSYGAFLFTFTSLIGAYMGLSSSVDYFIKKNDTSSNSDES